MGANRIGKSTLVFNNKPRVHSWSSIVGYKEGQGPLAHTFDIVLDKDDTLGEKSWEKAERKMYKEAVKLAMHKGGKHPDEVQALLGGDLLNQIITASFAARDLGLPFLGMYNACSTMSESMLVAAALVDGGYVDCAACAVSSHFSTAERQYRSPLELGSQRTPTQQWTVTGAGCTIICNDPAGIAITHGTIGTVVDYGVTDANNMGAAMAPAAAICLKTHLEDMACSPDDYDLIVTGDLGHLGHGILIELMKQEGITLGENYIDCGREIFAENQDVHAGGSGCASSAVVLNGYIMEKFIRREIKKVLFMATGALLSPTSSMQGDSIPGIAHAVVLEGG